MALIVGPSEVKPHDFEKIVKPTVHDFDDAMYGMFAGREPLATTMALFVALTDTERCPRAAVDWLYGVPVKELMRKIQHRRCNAT